MNKFVCYTLEGLKEQDRNQVWIMLGSFQALESAQAASEQAIADGDVIDTRVMSYVRDAEWWNAPLGGQTISRPHVAVRTQEREQAGIVA